MAKNKWSRNKHMQKQAHTFTAVLYKLESWVVAPLPSDSDIEAVHSFGRTPVIAMLGEKSWKTSLWTDKEGATMLPLPKKIRGNLCEGDEVTLTFVYDHERF